MGRGIVNRPRIRQTAARVAHARPERGEIDRAPDQGAGLVKIGDTQVDGLNDTVRAGCPMRVWRFSRKIGKYSWPLVDNAAGSAAESRIEVGVQCAIGQQERHVRAAEAVVGREVAADHQLAITAQSEGVNRRVRARSGNKRGVWRTG